MKNKIIFIPVTILFLAAITACSGSPNLSYATPTPTTAPALPPTTSLPSTSGNSLEELQQAYESVYQAVLPSVVNIQVIKTVRNPFTQIPDFANPDQPPQNQLSALGSGFLWDKSGHIVTNNHVVEGADTIRVTFSDGTSKSATLIGADTDSDLAVIKVEKASDKLTPIQLADSTQVKVGQIAIAIGNPFGLQGTMTVGVISGLGRSLPVESSAQDGSAYTIPDVIQTDAPINPGNSGGVLVDIYGRLIGVTTAIESPVRGNAGIGYVVPSIIVQKVVPALIAKGFYQHAWLGISGRSLMAELAQAMNLNPDQRGALVIKVSPNSPADKAGFQGSDREATISGRKTEIGGDIITRVEGQSIDDFEDVAAYLARYGEVGKTIQVTVLRGVKEQQLSVTLQARPAKSVPTQPEPKSQVSGKSWLGIQGMNLTSEIVAAMKLPEGTQGILVVQITQGSPADEAGLRGSFKPFTVNGQEVLIGGDVITKVDNVTIVSMTQLKSIIDAADPGTRIKLEIIRENKTQTVEVTLAAKPNQ